MKLAAFLLEDILFIAYFRVLRINTDAIQGNDLS